uniref:Uncharacterized protein n=1 Tax=Rhizophora mucronata TaxID=61149 RepID=A0A2P2J6E8_RHIMU
MHKRIQVSVFRNLEHQFQSSPKPTNPFSRKSVAPTLTQFSPSLLSCPGPKFIHRPASNLHTPAHSFAQNNQTELPIFETRRRHSTESGGGDSVAGFDVNKEVDLINLKFAEAREEIESALDSKETVYFNEEAEGARAAVKEVLDLFDGLLEKLPESEKTALQRSMGLKMEQLKAELLQLDE